MLFGTGDEVRIELGPASAVGHIIEAQEHQPDGWIIKYITYPAKITCIVSALTNCVNLPSISGGPRDHQIFESTAWLYYKDPQDNNRLHIWPCPVSAKYGYVLTDDQMIAVAKQRIDHVMMLQRYQNSQYEIVPGTDKEFKLHKNWWKN